MCMQCVTGVAVAATASATGLRAWIGGRSGRRPSPRTMRVITALVVTGGVIAAGLQF
jgi:hypothetical protein